MGALTDRVAIVTGASAGIGEAIANAFAGEGATVVLAARRVDELERAAAGIVSRGGSALAVRCDVTSEDDIVALFATTLRAFGRVDVLVNNAGIAGRRPIEELTLAYWNEVVAVNLTAAFLASREAVKVMKAQQPQGGRIINIGSIAAKTPREDALVYAATKSALHGLTHQLTLAGRAYGVVASVVHPGNTLTKLSQTAAGPGAPPGGRMDPADIARVVLLMATLPPGVNLFEANIVPNNMPSFIGRG
jgi:NAD(P)-dependent dehydrogenase (short-subunit alcohol dehydrogenase family)